MSYYLSAFLLKRIFDQPTHFHLPRLLLSRVKRLNMEEYLLRLGGAVFFHNFSQDELYSLSSSKVLLCISAKELLYPELETYLNLINVDIGGVSKISLVTILNYIRSIWLQMQILDVTKCFVLLLSGVVPKTITVKLGYNDHGYNEFTAITNKIWSIFGSQMITLLHKPSRL